MKLAMRTFLHDISTPLTIVMGSIGIVLSQLESDSEQHQQQIIKLKKAQDALNKIEKLVTEMRNKLHGETES